MSESGGQAPAAGMRPLPLTLGRGWKTAEPCEEMPSLLWEEGGQLYRGDAGSRQLNRLGEIGTIDCPLAVDVARSRVYRYVCPDGSRTDYSELRAVDVVSGQHEVLFRLGLNQWMLWLLHYLKVEDVVLGLVATHMPGEGIRIQHQLGFFDLKKCKRLLVGLPRDAFTPVAVHAGRREVLFHGAEGWQLVDYHGKRVGHLRSRTLPLGRGGSFHPEAAILALGGHGIALWNRERNTVQEVHSRGQHPVWSPDGGCLWFSESSSDLWVHYPARGASERVLSVAGNPHAEVTMSRPPVPSPDGRWLALPLTRKVRREGSASGAGGTAYVFQRSLAVLDLKTKGVVQYPRAVANPAWLVDERSGE